MKRFILILFLLLAAREIRAFGLAGHAAIACIAEHHLTPRARANIMRYTDHRSIVYYASWMDEWRRSKGYEFTTHWHAGTVDAEFRSTPAVREASGAKGDCVVAVEQSIALLSEYDKLDDSTVLVHIKYLVHLLGDMHCPTHVYYYPDNMTLGKFPVKLHGVETNYHKIWDGQLLDSRHKFWGFQDYRHALDNYTDEEIARMTEGTPVEWFEESARRCREIYDWVQPGDELGQEFYNAPAPFAEYQLVLSGYRLAKVLNALFDR